MCTPCIPKKYTKKLYRLEAEKKQDVHSSFQIAPFYPFAAIYEFSFAFFVAFSLDSFYRCALSAIAVFFRRSPEWRWYYHEKMLTSFSSVELDESHRSKSKFNLFNTMIKNPHRFHGLVRSILTIVFYLTCDHFQEQFLIVIKLHSIHLFWESLLQEHHVSH